MYICVRNSLQLGSKRSHMCRARVRHTVNHISPLAAATLPWQKNCHLGQSSKEELRRCILTMPFQQKKLTMNQFFRICQCKLPATQLTCSTSHEATVDCSEDCRLLYCHRASGGGEQPPTGRANDFQFFCETFKP